MGELASVSVIYVCQGCGVNEKMGVLQDVCPWFDECVP